MSGMALFAGEGEFRHCVRIVGTVEDITVKKHAGQVERLLVEAGREFALSLDLEETMSNIAHVGALAIGDLCVIELLEDGGRRRVEVAVRHEEDEPIAQWFRERPALEHPESTEMRALATRQPVLLTNVDAEYVETLRLGEEALALLRERGPVSVMTLPILGSEEPLGTMLFLAIGRENAFDPQSLALATQMTRRAALHVENAILYEQAQQALRMRDELQRIVAHDLRDPLNAISLSAGLMARLIDSGRYEKLDAALDNQRKAITSMKHLITDLLCAAKLEVGHLTIHPRPTPCVEVVKDVVELYELTAEEKSVALERELPDDLPPVQADPPRLQQVLANLVGNAVEHTPPGGRVRIGARHTDSMVQFEVSDTGPGISPEDQQHVFDRFWKKEGDGAGAGLGLWIAHEIVDLHGGDLCVSSALGAGTTFRFTLPVATRE
jgi:signal transduction histidine kinase